jgi:hypothetical protein
MRDCDVNVLRRVGAHPGAPFAAVFIVFSQLYRFSDQPAPLWQVCLLQPAQVINQIFSISF